MLTKRTLESRKQVELNILEDLVPKGHLIRLMDRFLALSFVYEVLEKSYCLDNGRPSVDPVVLVKIAIIKKMFGISSLRKTLREIQVNAAYRWYLGYSFNEKIPHFTTYVKNYSKRFGENDLFKDFFERILEMAFDNNLIEPDVIFIDGSHIKASANKNKRHKELIEIKAKEYQEDLDSEINAARAELGKKPLKKKKITKVKEVTVSNTDPDSGMFFKTDKERSFAYSAHTACDSRGMVVGVKVTAGNVHDIKMLQPLVKDISENVVKPDLVVVDAGYRSAPTSHAFENMAIQLVIPYRNNNKSKSEFRKSKFKYNVESNKYTCPEGNIMTSSTVNKEGNIVYRCERGICQKCDQKSKCFTASVKSKAITRHIWQDSVDRDEAFRKTPEGRLHYSARKETIERVFADGKEQHGMRYTRLRGLGKVTQEVYLLFACMNLKKMVTRLNRMGRLTA